MDISKKDNFFVISGILIGDQERTLYMPFNSLFLDVEDNEDSNSKILLRSVENGDVICESTLTDITIEGSHVDSSTIWAKFGDLAFQESGSGEVEEMDWFRIENLESSEATVTLNNDASADPLTLKVSTDKKKWIEYANISVSTEFKIPANGTLYFNGKTNSHWSKLANIWRFRCDKKHNIAGDMSTLVSDMIEVPEYLFSYLFYLDSKLVSAGEIKLPWTTLGGACYHAMFKDCSSLTKAPELPATNLTASCYNATFAGCTSLTEAPELPATNLMASCYNAIFSGCSSLTKAPELPATTLVDNCYFNAFNGCSKLSEVTCLATNISATGATTNWLSGCSSTGTFTCATGMSSTWTSGESGIPEGWTVNETNA